MLGLSPIRLLIIVVVALILLGPDKLPSFARQAGAAWKSLKSIQERVETELRDAVPDLPRTSDIARYARSPISLLNKLADDHTSAQEAASTVDADGADAAAAGAGGSDEGYQVADDPPEVRDPERPPVAWGDPTLN